MYSAREVLSGLTRPKRGAMELWRLYNRRIRGRDGIKVMDEDWDNLIILDACRYDAFAAVKEEFDLPGNLEPVVSRGSATTEFMEKNFTDDSYPDTVYVSANAHLQRATSKFHDRVRVYKHDTERIWEDKYQNDPIDIPLPDTTADRALKTNEKYPNKRLIVHFMQPHSPHIGETGKQLHERDTLWWQKLRDGEVDYEDVYRAYMENLRLTIPHVQRLISELEGKTVVTADHGELFGDNIWNLYEHPAEMYTTDLVTVPWLVIESGRRKTITEGDARSGPGEMTEAVENSLRDLGYLQQQ